MPNIHSVSGFNYTEGWVHMRWRITCLSNISNMIRLSRTRYGQFGGDLTNNAIMEIESLGAKKLQPSESVRHHEKWTLLRFSPYRRTRRGSNRSLKN